MIELPSFYPHQEKQRDDTRAAVIRKGRVILCAPPGGGKTRLSKWILGSYLNKPIADDQSGKALFCVHRRGLVDNAIGSFAEEPPLPHGTIMSGCDTSYGNRMQVASIDTLLSWFYTDGKYSTDITFDFVTMDEVHSHFSKLKTFLEGHDAKRAEMGLRPAAVLGLSATPECRGLADVFQEIVTGPTTAWLIENEYLSPFRYFRATQGKLDLLVKRGGEFTKDSVCDAMDGLGGDLVRDWKKYAEGRATVGFFPRLSHAKDAQDKLIAAGIKAEYVDGSSKDEDRRMLFRMLNEGRIDYLCNVGVVERGTDIPRIGCVQLATAIGSRVRFLQMIGRGSRRHPEKTDCLIIDHANSIKLHGFFDDPHHWTLDRSKAKDEDIAARPTIECPACQRIYRGGACVCGYEPTPKERKSQGLEFDGTELIEVTRKEKANAKEKSAEELMVTALYQAGRSGRTWRQACGIYFRLCVKHYGRKMCVPGRFKVGGREYQSISSTDPQGSRRVSALYDFVS